MPIGELNKEESNLVYHSHRSMHPFKFDGKPVLEKIS